MKKVQRIVLVTGANGFVGRSLCLLLKKKGYVVRASVRARHCAVSGADEYILTGDVAEFMGWPKVLTGVDTVIHLAGITNGTNDGTPEECSLYRKINVAGTGRLARACIKAGVRRFIYLSSAAVHGKPVGKKIFTEKEMPRPIGAYAVSKWEAEQVLRKVVEGFGMETVILRPPFVYGPDRLRRFIRAEILPFWDRKNVVRSLVCLGNLTDVIIRCIGHSRAVGQTFLVSDGSDVQARQLGKLVAVAMKKKPGIAGLLHGISDGMEVERLAGSFRIDSRKAMKLLAWKPRVSVKRAVVEMVRDYKGEASGRTGVCYE